MITNDDMVIVNGVQYRPEDVPGKGKATDSSGEETTVGPVTPDDMVIVDGIAYRPEDAPKRPKGGADADEKAGAVTSKTAQPRNKSRSAASKG